jgi:hypothetical protein
MPAAVSTRVATDWQLLDVASPVTTTHPLARGLVHWWLCAPGYLGGLVWRDLAPNGTRKSDLTVTNVTAELFWNRSSTTPVAPHRGGHWATKGNDAGYGTTPVFLDWYTNGTTAFTFACWFRRAVVSTDSIAVGQGSTTLTHAELLLWNDGLCYFLFPANAQGGNADCYPYFTSNDTNWHQITYIYDGSQTGNANRLICWMDGQQQTLTFTGPGFDPIPAQINFTPTGNFEVHRRVENTAETYDGYVNDLAIWNRPLTQAEAHAWYHSSLQAHPQLLRRLRPYRRRSETAVGGRTTRNTLASPLGSHLGRGLWTHGGSG